jgi:transposase-like protein
MSATVEGVSPQNRGIITAADQKRLRAALAARDASDQELHAAVLAAASHGASVREIATFTGLSTNTISRWKRGE